MATIKSIEEKAKAYDKAIKRVEDIEAGKCQKPFVFTEGLFDYIFPELKESEDERMMNQLHSWMKEFGGAEEYTEKVYLWLKGLLEKQGEHAKFRDSIQVGDNVTRNEDGVLVNLSQLNRVAKKDEKQGEQKPAWSEEDKKKVNNLYVLLDQMVSFNMLSDKDATEFKDWLKSLKDRYTWKPSDEQIKVLVEVLIFAANNESPHWQDYIYGILKNLTRQLKKLREE